MNKTIRAAAAISAFALACASAIMLGAADATAQGPVSKAQLVGTWLLVSAETTTAAGVKQALVEGPDMKGQLMFDGARFSLQVISEVPRLASKDRLVTTPEENKAVAHGVLSYFGTYTVNESDGTLMLRIERSSYANQNASEFKRVITVLNADELRYEAPQRIGGGSNVLVWRRSH